MGKMFRARALALALAASSIFGVAAATASPAEALPIVDANVQASIFGQHNWELGRREDREFGRHRGWEWGRHRGWHHRRFCHWTPWGWRCDWRWNWGWDWDD